MKEFWALVGNVRRLRKNSSFRATPWWKIYIGFFYLVALGAFCLAVYRGAAGPLAMLFIIPVILFFGLVFSMSAISHEWKGQTFAWWLTLPYSRAELLLAKLVGSFIRFLKTLAASVVVLAVLAVIGMLLNPAVWSAAALGSAAAAAVRLYAVVLAASPLVLTTGMFLEIIMRSRLRPLAPVVWAGTIYLVSLGFSYVVLQFFGNGGGWMAAPDPGFMAADPPVVLLGIAALIASSAVIFCISAYLLARQTEA